MNVKLLRRGKETLTLSPRHYLADFQDLQDQSGLIGNIGLHNHDLHRRIREYVDESCIRLVLKVYIWGKGENTKEMQLYMVLMGYVEYGLVKTAACFPRSRSRIGL